MSAYSKEAPQPVNLRRIGEAESLGIASEGFVEVPTRSFASHAMPPQSLPPQSLPPMIDELVRFAGQFRQVEGMIHHERHRAETIAARAHQDRAKLQQELQAARAEIENFKGQLQKSHAQISKLRERDAALTAAGHELKRKAEAVASANRSLKQQLAETQARAESERQDLLQKLSAEEDDKNSLLRRLATIRGEFEERIAELEKSREKGLNDERMRTEAVRKELGSSLEKSQEKIKELSEQLAQGRKQSGRIAQREAHAIRVGKDLQERFNALRERYVALERELSAARLQITAMAAKESTMAAQGRAMAAEVEGWRHRSQTMDRELATVRDANRVMEEQRKKEIRELGAGMSQAMESARKAYQELASKAQQLEKANQELRQALGRNKPAKP